MNIKFLFTTIIKFNLECTKCNINAVTIVRIIHYLSHMLMFL